MRWDWIGGALSCLSGPWRAAEAFYQWRVLRIRKVTPARMDGSYGRRRRGRQAEAKAQVSSSGAWTKAVGLEKTGGICKGFMKTGP